MKQQVVVEVPKAFKDAGKAFEKLFRKFQKLPGRSESFKEVSKLPRELSLEDSSKVERLFPRDSLCLQIIGKQMIDHVFSERQSFVKRDIEVISGHLLINLSGAYKRPINGA